MRFLNQKLGKRTSRKLDLVKSRLDAERVPKRSLQLENPFPAPGRLPKKGTSRETGKTNR